MCLYSSFIHQDIRVRIHTCKFKKKIRNQEAFEGAKAPQKSEDTEVCEETVHLTGDILI